MRSTLAKSTIVHKKKTVFKLFISHFFVLNIKLSHCFFAKYFSSYLINNKQFKLSTICVCLVCFLLSKVCFFSSILLKYEYVGHCIDQLV